MAEASLARVVAYCSSGDGAGRGHSGGRSAEADYPPRPLFGDSFDIAWRSRASPRWSALGLTRSLAVDKTSCGLLLRARLRRAATSWARPRSGRGFVAPPSWESSASSMGGTRIRSLLRRAAELSGATPRPLFAGSHPRRRVETQRRALSCIVRILEGRRYVPPYGLPSSTGVGILERLSAASPAFELASHLLCCVNPRFALCAGRGVHSAGRVVVPPL